MHGLTIAIFNFVFSVLLQKAIELEEEDKRRAEEAEKQALEDEKQALEAEKQASLNEGANQHAEESVSLPSTVADKSDGSEPVNSEILHPSYCCSTLE